jgi:hypothetical protein
MRRSADRVTNFSVSLNGGTPSCEASAGVPASEVLAMRLVAQMDEEAGEMSVVFVCNRCPQQEILPIG